MNNKQIKLHFPRYTVLASRKVSTLKGDAHLMFIVVKKNGEYISYLYNTNDNGCYEGKYFKRMLDAMKAHATRN
jgi:hypothetical protein